MTTKKALKAKIEALEKELAKTKKELEAARYSANSTHLYREHCVQNWLEADKAVEALEIENATLRAENRRLIGGLCAIKSNLAAKEYYHTTKEVQ